MLETPVCGMILLELSAGVLDLVTSGVLVGVLSGVLGFSAGVLVGVVGVTTGVAVGVAVGSTGVAVGFYRGGSRLRSFHKDGVQVDAAYQAANRECTQAAGAQLSSIGAQDKVLFAPNVPAFELPALVCDNGGRVIGVSSNSARFR